MYNTLKSLVFSKSFITPFIAFLLGASLVLYWHFKIAKPTTQTEIVEKIVEKEKIVYKESTETKQKINENRDIETKIITRPDGSTETIIIDKTVVKSEKDESKQIDISQEKTKITEKETVIVENPPKDWRIGAHSYLDSSDALKLDKSALEYQFDLSRRVLGPVWVSSFYSTENNIGLGIAIEF